MPAKPSEPRVATKPANTFSVMWPASMLAKSRIDSEIGREMKESTSMKVTNGSSTAGRPLGTNSLRKRKPCRRKP